MGQVYCAHDPRLERDVAIKILPEGFLTDAERLRRFEQEAKAIAQLNHPNIVQVFDRGICEQVPYLVMELVEGPSLRSWMGHMPVPPRKAVEMVIQIAQGLAAAHEVGIVHRDLKPENVLVGKDGRARILDFGLAKLFHGPDLGSFMGTECETVTGNGHIVGTLGYMAPEQISAGRMDGRTDIFALGVILWEMLTCSRPFQGDSSIDTMHAILRQDTPELPLDLKVPLALERVLRRCLEKEPATRFQNARDLAFALENLPNSSSTTSQSQLPTLSMPSVRRRPVFWWASIGLAACTLAGGFLFLSRSNKAQITYSYPVTQELEVNEARLLPGGRGLVMEGRSSRTDPTRIWLVGIDGTPIPVSGTEGCTLLDVLPDGSILLAHDPMGQPGSLALIPAGGGRPIPFSAGVVWHIPWDGKGRPWRMRVGLDEQKTHVARLFEESMPPDPKAGESEGWKLRHTIPLSVSIAGPAPRGQFRMDARGEHLWWLEQEGTRTALVEMDRQGVATRRTLSPEVPFNSLSLASGPSGYLATYPKPGGSSTILAQVGSSGGLKPVCEFPSSLRIQDVSPEGFPVLLPERSVERVRWGTFENAIEREIGLGSDEHIQGLAPDGKSILTVAKESARIHRREGVETIHAPLGRPLSVLGDQKGLAWATHGSRGLTLKVQPLEAQGEEGVSIEGWKVLTFARTISGRNQLLVGGLRDEDEQLGPHFTYLVSLKGGLARRLPSETLPVADPDGAKALWLIQDGLTYSWGPLDLSTGLKESLPFTSPPNLHPLAWPSAHEVVGAVRLGPDSWEVKAIDLIKGKERLLGRIAIPYPAQDSRETSLRISSDAKTWTVIWTEHLPTRPFIAEGF